MARRARNKGSKGPRAKCSASSFEDLLNGKEPPIAAPVAEPVVEVEEPLVAAPAEAHDAAAAVHLRGRTEADDGVLALLLGEGRTEREAVDVRGRCEVLFLHRGDGVLAKDVAAEVEEPGAEPLLAGAFDGEALGGDVGVDPVVLAGCDHVGKGRAVVEAMTWSVMVSVFMNSSCCSGDG
jgi:hypothetical protein